METDDKSKDEVYRLNKEILRLKREIARQQVNIERLELIVDRSTSLTDIVLIEHELEFTKRHLEIFRKFVPLEFLSVLVEDPFKATLGDQVKLDLYILFSDIRNFTSISESLSVEQTFAFLNDYLGRTEGPIVQNHGFVDKYIGDAIMAIFTSADDAVNAAIELQKVARDYNHTNQFSKDFQIGIGIHRGELMLGIVGSTARMQSTVIGDPANIASRLDGLSALFRAPIVVSEEVTKGLSPSFNRGIRNLGEVKLKGKIKANRIYEVIEGEPESVRKLKTEAKQAFEEALAFFRKRDFDHAETLFRGIFNKNPQDGASEFYLHKCASYKSGGVPEGWDGSEQLSEK